MYERVSVIAFVLLVTARSEEISPNNEVKNANLTGSRLPTILLPCSSHDDHRFTNDDREEPLLLSVPSLKRTPALRRTERCATPRKTGAPLSSAKRDIARAKARNITETVASSKRKEAEARQGRTLNLMGAKDAVASARPREQAAETCNADKCVCYCSKEENGSAKKSSFGHRKKDRNPERGSNYRKESEENENAGPGVLQRYKRPKLHEGRPRESILTGLINRFPARFYQERMIPGVHHHHHVPAPYAPRASPEIMGGLRPNGVPYHGVPSYGGQNILLGNSHGAAHGHYPPLIHRNLYPWSVVPERGEIGSPAVSIASPSPSNVGKTKTGTDDDPESYDQGDYFESHDRGDDYPELYDQFVDYPESRDPVVGKNEDPQLSTVASSNDEDASVESKTNADTRPDYSAEGTEESGAASNGENSTVGLPGATETSALEEPEYAGRSEGTSEPSDNRGSLDHADEARVAVKKLTDQATERATKRGKLLGKSKSKTTKLLLSPEGTNVPADEGITEKVVTGERADREQQGEIVAASYDTFEDGSDDSSTKVGGLPFCDNTLLLNAIGKAIDHFVPDPHLARTKTPDETRGLSSPEVPRASNLKNILSVPRIEETIVERVKDVLSADASIPRRALTSDWSHSVIRNTLRSVVDTLHGIQRKLSPRTEVEEHRYEDGQWTTDEEVTLTPASDSRVSAVNPGNLILNASDQITGKISDPAIRDRLNGVFQAMRDAARKEAASSGSTESDDEGDTGESPSRETEDNSRQTIMNKNAMLRGEGFDAKEYINTNNNNYQKAKILENNVGTLINHVHPDLSESLTSLSIENISTEDRTPSRVIETETEESVGDPSGATSVRDNEERASGEEPLESSMIDQQADSRSNDGASTVSVERDPEAGNEGRDEGVAATPGNFAQGTTPGRGASDEAIPPEVTTGAENEAEPNAPTTSLDDFVGNARHEGRESPSAADHIDPLIILERITNTEPPIEYYPPENSEDVAHSSDGDDPSGTSDAYSLQLSPSSPAFDDIAELGRSQLYYVNDGVKFPLEIQRLGDGTYVLSFPKDVCEHFLQRECPCCVPRTGHVVRSTSDRPREEGARAIPTTERNDRRENTRDSRPEEEQSTSTHRFSKRTLNDDPVTVSMPVTDFAERYNLLLDLDKERLLADQSGSRDETRNDELLKKSVEEYGHDRSEGRNLDGDREMTRTVEGNLFSEGNVPAASVNIPRRSEERKTARARGSGDQGRNFIPQRTILSAEEARVNKLPDAEEGSAEVFRKKKKRENEGRNNGRPFRYQRNANEGAENKSAELLKSVLYWFKGLILDE